VLCLTGPTQARYGARMRRTSPLGAISRARRAVPGIIWSIVVLHVAVVLWQTVLFPNFRSPDEQLQADLIVAVERGVAWPWPSPGTLWVSTGSRAGGFAPSTRVPGALHLADVDLPPRDKRLTYDAAGGLTPALAYHNQLIQHPPLYYVLGAGALALTPGWQQQPFDLSFLLLRWWNILLAIPLPLLLWAAARRLRLPDPLPVAAALVPLAVPELTHTESAINNDNLLITLFGVLTLLVVRVITGDTSRRTAVAVGVVGSLALLTKGFALVIPVWVGLAYLVAVLRSRERRRSTLLSLGIAWVLTLPGLAWWIHNRVAYGALQPYGNRTEPPVLTPKYSFSESGWGWLSRLVERLNTLFFVHDQTGLRQHHLPWKMAILAGAIMLLGVAVTLVWRSIPRLTALVLLFPLAGTFAIVAQGSWTQFAATHSYHGMQGRYLYAGLAGLALVAVAATAKLPDRLRRLTPVAVLLFAVAMQTVYLTYTVALFWAPARGDQLEKLGASVGAMLDWYALPPPFVIGIVLAVIASFVATLIGTLRLARRSPDIDEPLPAEDVAATAVA
jgi:Dolichyl-phosphate-mannose-protein mannosyltransferase